MSNIMKCEEKHVANIHTIQMEKGQQFWRREKKKKNKKTIPTDHF